MDLRKRSVMIVLLCFLLFCKAQAAVHYYDFVLKEKNFTKLCSTKSILTVNGSFPGPTISARKGDIVYVTVHNDGTYGVTVHCDWTRATVHGAIVIHPPLGASYPFPEPHGQETLIIGEWYKGDVMKIIMASGGEPNASDAYTINGQPGDLYACSNGTTHRFSVVSGKTYLLHIFNADMNENHYFESPTTHSH
ncbi:hypothetical protein K1719_044382 [Acacia pycnantha]|nr:hypothetical protein K1719_044382 [Acacia pycnantha]